LAVRFYEASSQIAATPDAVWPVLVDAAAWPTWDSGVVAVDGQLALGNTVSIRTEVAKGRVFPVKVTEFRPADRLQFSGGMPLGLFRGVRTYTLTGDGADGTQFRMREQYTGPLVALIWRSMPDLQASFDRFARGLKARVESGG
jgi:hypothetical protein